MNLQEMPTFLPIFAAFDFSLPSETTKVLLAVLPVFAIAVIGVFMRKMNWLTEQADQFIWAASDWKSIFLTRLSRFPFGNAFF